jgi:hypothetical protein
MRLRAAYLRPVSVEQKFGQAYWSYKAAVPRCGWKF